MVEVLYCVVVIPTNNRGYVLFVYVLVKPYNMSCIIQWYKSTPLHYAARQGHTNIVSLLVDHGAGVDMKDQVSLCEYNVMINELYDFVVTCMASNITL